MYSLSILCCFLSVGCLYTTAQKTELEKKGVLEWLSQHATFSRLLSFVLLFACFLLLLQRMGLTISILTSVCLWMLTACLMVLFAPFHKVTYIHLGAIFLMILGVELFIVTL